MSLRKYLDKYGLSDAEFARSIKKSRSYVTKLAAGLFEPPLRVIRVIERETNREVTVDDFMRKARPRKAKENPKRPLVAA